MNVAMSVTGYANFRMQFYFHKSMRCFNQFLTIPIILIYGLIVCDIRKNVVWAMDERLLNMLPKTKHSFKI